MSRRAPWLAILAFALPMAACDTGTEMRSGSVSILLTDAPGEVTEAWVTITDIYLQGGGGEEDPPRGRVYLMEGGEETHELLSLANTVAELVTDVEVPAGTYGQLRVVISGGCLVTADGGVFTSSAAYTECGPRTGTLMMPSFAQSGAKVRLNGLTVSGGQNIVLLDFDVSQSFGRAAGQSGNWVMTPVIHAAEVGLTTGVTASLSAGDVTLPEGVTLADFSATLTPDVGDASEVKFTESNGTFRAEFRFLIAENGPFGVTLNAPEGWSVGVSPVSPQVVNPASGQTATVSWTLQSIQASGS
jgi:hypothetical protein